MRCGTSISFAIDLGGLLLDEFAVNVCNQIIDISANGTNNDGLPVQGSPEAGNRKDYTINAIAIPSITRGMKYDLISYFAQNVLGGPNAFVIAPATKSDYATALHRKLEVEIGRSARRWASSSVGLGRSRCPRACKVAASLSDGGARKLARVPCTRPTFSASPSFVTPIARR